MTIAYLANVQTNVTPPRQKQTLTISQARCNIFWLRTDLLVPPFRTRGSLFRRCQQEGSAPAQVPSMHRRQHRCNRTAPVHQNTKINPKPQTSRGKPHPSISGLIYLESSVSMLTVIARAKRQPTRGRARTPYPCRWFIVSRNM